MNRRRKDHPVWGVYDLLRTVRLNELYFERRLHARARINRLVEIIILITAPTSAVAGWSLWNAEEGQAIWKALVSLTGLLAIVKQGLGLTDDIRGLEVISTLYRALRVDLEVLRSRIAQDEAYSGPHRERHDELLELRSEITKSEPKHVPQRDLIADLMQDVNGELPIGGFYVPPYGNDQNYDE
jgi:hypothetical protein